MLCVSVHVCTNQEYAELNTHKDEKNWLCLGLHSGELQQFVDIADEEQHRWSPTHKLCVCSLLCIGSVLASMPAHLAYHSH